MVDNAKAGLLRALGRVVRGLSVLFWALILTALLYFKIAQDQTPGLLPSSYLNPVTMGAALGLSAFIWFGLNQLRPFQPQERIWQRAVFRAQLIAVVDAGLAPFFYWWRHFPTVPLFSACVALLFVGSLCLLMQINSVLRRLAAMLPDESLRDETRLITTLNVSILAGVLVALALLGFGSKMGFMPEAWSDWLEQLREEGLWLVLFLILLPLALTLALIWKIKEIIFASLLTPHN